MPDSTLSNPTLTDSTKPPKAVHDPKLVALGRMIFSALGVVCPAAGGWLAERAFVMPRRIDAPLHEQKIRDAATHSFQVPFEGMALDALRWEGPGPTVLLAHGWEGRGTQLGRFVEPLLAAGYNVVAFDGPAHGRSPGKETELLHFSRVFAAMHEAVGPIDAVIAHSFGGAACAMALSTGRFTTNRLVMIGSPARIMYPMGQFREILQIPDNVWRRFLARMERRMGIKAEALDLARMATHLTVPALIIHCRDDTEVTFDNALRIQAAWPHAQFISTDGLGHRRILKDPDVIHATLEFLRG